MFSKWSSLFFESNWSGLDGAIGADQSVRAAEKEQLAPLVNHVVGEPSLETAS